MSCIMYKNIWVFFFFHLDYRKINIWLKHQGREFAVFTYIYACSCLSYHPSRYQNNKLLIKIWHFMYFVFCYMMIVSIFSNDIKVSKDVNKRFWIIQSFVKINIATCRIKTPEENNVGDRQQKYVYALFFFFFYLILFDLRC